MYGLEGTDREPSDEDIEEAARLANAASFIEVSIFLVWLDDALMPPRVYSSHPLA